ncbi:hypothetical protein GGQ73_004692 [Rhizobium skierniewicense]|uniref:Uncharacterized protein n=1 Tax=Rhizobium skierniewicense TaxID=984260 RepID=A0A7W6CC16_9HYPH|nr:hypothetical protein [Rhizobium skierniewicense]
MPEYHQNKTRHLLHLVLPAGERDFKYYKGKISRRKSKYEYFPILALFDIRLLHRKFGAPRWGLIALT